MRFQGKIKGESRIFIKKWFKAASAEGSATLTYWLRDLREPIPLDFEDTSEKSSNFWKFIIFYHFIIEIFDKIIEDFLRRRGAASPTNLPK